LVFWIKKGLLLSELGKYICGTAHAPAGTKRISNLLRSKNWNSDVLEKVQLEKAKDYVLFVNTSIDYQLTLSITHSIK